jgi:hypothetical protein
MKLRKNLFCLLVICFFGMKAHSQVPVTDVVRLMEMVDQVEKHSLWPGFHPQEIPTAVFDGVSTYLFRHPSPPDGFSLFEGMKDVYVFKGQHGQVRGNSRVQIGGIWTATCVPRTHSRLTGKKYSLQNLAGIVIHEQFHVFQRLKHADWRPNDGHLFNYPMDTPEMLALRTMEIEAFRRAVCAEGPGEVSGWAREALMWRDKRHHLLEDALAQYEGELQRFEGLADYVECITGDKDMKQLPVDPGFAPGAIRHLGYIAGRWMASILDKLQPDWKTVMESGQAEYLHDILEKALSPPEPMFAFTAEEREVFFEKAKEEVENRRAETRALKMEFDSQPGFRIEIVAENNPLRLRMFFADRTEALSERKLLHHSLLMVGNERASISIRNLKSITQSDGSTNVIGLTIAGIAEKPVIENRDGKIKVSAKGIQAEFSGAEVRESPNAIKIVL